MDDTNTKTAETENSELMRAPNWLAWLAIIVVAAVYYLSQIISSLAVSIYPIVHHWSIERANNWLNASVPAQFFYVLIAEIATVAAVYLFLRVFKFKLKDIGLKKPRIRDPLFALAALPIYFIVFLVLSGVAAHFFKGINLNQTQQIGFNVVHGGFNLALTFVSLVILPPIAEEILFRGYLFTSLKKVLPVIWAGVITSLLFAAAHLSEGGSAGPLWIGAIDTFALSLVLVYLRQKTGSLWAEITLHAFKNLIAFISLFLLAGR